MRMRRARANFKAHLLLCLDDLAAHGGFVHLVQILANTPSPEQLPPLYRETFDALRMVRPCDLPATRSCGRLVRARLAYHDNSVPFLAPPPTTASPQPPSCFCGAAPGWPAWTR